MKNVLWARYPEQMARAVVSRARLEAAQPAPRMKTLADRHAVVIEAMLYKGGWSRTYGVVGQMRTAKAIAAMLAKRDKRIEALERALKASAKTLEVVAGIR